MAFTYFNRMAKWEKSCRKNAGEQRVFTAADLISFKSKKNQRHFIQAKYFRPNKY